VKYEVRFDPVAAKALSKLDRPIRLRVAGVIETLAQDPRPPAAAQLRGDTSLWRIRAGDYRIVYVIQDRVLLVLVVKIGHRRDVYER
jgi:mRNA interferase RelE/StbE